MDTNFLAKPVFSSSGGPLTPGMTLTMSGPAGSLMYYCVDGSDPRMSGGTISPKALIYRSPIALSASATIVARAFSPSHQNLTGANNPPRTTPWSGPTTATFGWVTTPTQLVYTNPGSVYAQNFNSLPDPGLTTVQSDNPVTINGVAYALANPICLASPAQTPGGFGGLGLSNTMPGCMARRG
jgi:hypothetical protein